MYIGKKRKQGGKALLCRGWCGLCCGRQFGLWTSPLRRYFEAFTASNFLPDLKINNAMNREAMQQVLDTLSHTFYPIER